MLNLRLILILFLTLVISTQVGASAPNNNGQKPPVLSDLRIIVPTGIDLKALAFKRAAVIFPKPKTSKLNLKRVASFESFLDLVIIPSNESFAPIIKKIPNSKSELRLNISDFKEIKDDSLWLWGVTQKSHCRGLYANVDARFLIKPSLYQSIGGLFTWELKQDAIAENYILNIGMYAHDMASSVAGASLKRADKNFQLRCERYFGGKCKFLFDLSSLKPKQRYEFKFKKSFMVGSPGCPV